MKIKKLELYNLRGIQELNLDLTKADRLVVFVGINGAGKSSVLYGIRVLLSHFFARLRRPDRSTGLSLSDDDARNQAAVCSGAVVMTEAHTDIGWAIAKHPRGKPGWDCKKSDFSDLSKGLAKNYPVPQDAKALPIAVHYGVGRIAEDVKRIRERHDFSMLEVSGQGLDADPKTNFRRFFEWFRDREDKENEEAREVVEAGTMSLAEGRTPWRTDRQLQAVRQAIENFTGFKKLRIRRKPDQRMTLEKNGHELAVNRLSDGERCLLALVGDLAARLAICNPQADAPLTGEGIVLLDEAELHLHPSLQRDLLPRLLETFRGCQFIVTTHSPQVLSRVTREQMFLLEDGKMCGTDHAYGRDIHTILTRLMGVPPRPMETQDRLDECARLMDQDKFVEAETSLAVLEKQLGQDDPDVIGLHASLSFLRGAKASGQMD